MKKISILGSTGSIGTNTLDVIRNRSCDFQVMGLSAYENVKLLARQIKEFRPRVVSVKDDQTIKKLKALVNLKGIKVYPLDPGLCEISTYRQTQIVVVATAGIISLLPTLEAIDKGKIIALANKEPLVMAGNIVMKKIQQTNGVIIPVDSEHNAIFQCLRGEKLANLRNIYLTGSGGPFKDMSAKQIKNVIPEMALKHPKWKMGRKITIDSATLMNKGLELIEACWLFDVAPEKIKVVVHPEAIIHSMVEYCDGSVIAQMGITDMRLPIQYALDFPHRKTNHLKKIDFFKMKQLTFSVPDTRKFPCLKIAQDVAKKGGSLGSVMNAANEIAVEEFLLGNIGFTDIPKIINSVFKKHKFIASPNLNQIIKCDEWARREAKSLCCQL